MFRMGKAFVSLWAIWFLFLCLKKQDFKKVMLILALLSWKERRRVAFFSFFLPQTIQDFWQFTAVVLQEIPVKKWMASTSAAFFTYSHSFLCVCVCVCVCVCLCVCVCVCVCFCAPWRKSISQSLCLPHSQWSLRVVSLSSDLSQRIFVDKRNCFLIRRLLYLIETHTNTHICLTTLLTTSADKIHFLNRINPYPNLNLIHILSVGRLFSISSLKMLSLV